MREHKKPATVSNTVTGYHNQSTMETPKIRVPFSRKPIFVGTGDEIYDLFQNAVIPLMAGPWNRIDATQSWQDVLPYPEGLTAPMPTIIPMIAVTQPSRAAGLQAIYHTERGKWASCASEWLKSEKHYIKEQKRQVQKLIDEAIPNINDTYKKRLKPENVFNAWVNSVEGLSQSEFTALRISTKTMSGFLAQQANEYKNRLTTATVLPPVTCGEIEGLILENRRAKRKDIPFTELLIDFTKVELDALLVHVKLINEQGETILLEGKKSAIHGLLNGLPGNKIKDSSRDKLYRSLCQYLGMKITDVKRGYNSQAQNDAERLTISYMRKVVLTKK